tara:strand:+ start:366 stop:503 length:138 start_codon:yes stop_codon:yes gene_type:complete
MPSDATAADGDLHLVVEGVTLRFSEEANALGSTLQEKGVGRETCV